MVARDLDRFAHAGVGGFPLAHLAVEQTRLFDEQGRAANRVLRPSHLQIEQAQARLDILPVGVPGPFCRQSHLNGITLGRGRRAW